MFPTPQQLGLPRKFRSWRSDQPRVIQDGLDATRRWVVQRLQQGKGKTAANFGRALIDRERRYIFLTATKGLQDQYLSDFGGIGLVDIRGKASYSCEGLPGHTCQEGSVAKCMYKGSSLCGYGAARQAASNERLVTSNYSCWIALNKYSSGIGKFDVMVCDEAHSIPSELEKAMSVLLGAREVEEDLHRDWPAYNSRNDMDAWKRWALTTRIVAEHELERLKNEIAKAGKSTASRLAKQYNHYQQLTRRLADLATCRPDEWVADEWSHGYKFDPIDPSGFAERLLWRGIERIVLSSGTVTAKTCEQSGVDMSDCLFLEYETSLNPTRTPIMYIPTTKVNFYSQPWQLRKLVERIDEIFASRMDRKGIIHTSSGRLRDFIMSNSRFSRFFVSNYSNTGELTSHVIERFKRLDPPAALVSPSVTTGYDFPFDACRYQVVAKLNYPSAGSKVEQERLRLDPDRGSHHAVVALQQAAFRGYRSEDDFQEVFIIDDAYPTLAWRHGELFHPGFLACVKKLDRVPKAPAWEAA